RSEGNSFDGDFADIMGGVDEVIRMGIADSAHMAIAGHSWGSYETNWVITHTNRFRAAISFEGDADMSRQWGKLAAGNEFTEWMYGGPPWEKWSAYEKQSAMHYVRGVKTPALFIAGENSVFTDILKWMYAAWRRQNIPAGLLIYEKEGHG